MAPATHIIGRQRIRLRYNGTTDPLALRQKISNVCTDELPTRLNKLLDQYDDKDFVLHIDKLDVSVSLDDDGNLEEKLARAIIEKVEAVLRHKLKQRSSRPLSIDKSLARTLLFYLEKGYLPWWSLVKDTAAFNEALQQALEGASLARTILSILPALSSADARRRLDSLLSEEQFTALVLATGILSAAEWKTWQAHAELISRHVSLRGKSAIIYRLFREAVLETIHAADAATEGCKVLPGLFMIALKRKGILLEKELIRSLPDTAIQEALLTIVNTFPQEAERQDIKTSRAKQDDKKLRTTPESPQGKERNIQTPAEDESSSIGNAGLVLIALYLPAFFRNIGLLEDGKLTDIPRTVVLLRYLVYESEVFQEFEVVLEKILCGVPLAASVEAGHRISIEEKEQAEALLQSVIEHWTVLKNTTPSGLRNSFLQREGRIVFKNNQWELAVQKQAHDILLEYIPWNISLIKLPWMEHLLTVKWNT